MHAWTEIRRGSRLLPTPDPFYSLFSLSHHADFEDYILSRVTPYYDKKVVVYDAESRLYPENRVQGV
jgi:hypothetical protein